MTCTRFLDTFGSPFHTFQQASSLFCHPSRQIWRGFCWFSMGFPSIFIRKPMGNVDVLQFHTFGTPFLKSCSCCGSKESSRGPKSHFLARIDLEHAFMLINVSPNWLFRWRKMQNRWSTIQTHSVLMIFEAKIKNCWTSGSKVDLASELQSSSDIPTLFWTESVFYDVSLV